MARELLQQLTEDATQLLVVEFHDGGGVKYPGSSLTY